MLNELQEENIITNTQTENNTQTNQNNNQGNNQNTPPTSTKSDEEKAIEIVKEQWGDDETVDFVAEKNSDGTYTVAVRNMQTTRAEAFYTVNVQTGSFTQQSVY